MDEDKILILLKREDKTKEIEYLERNNDKIKIKFYNEEKIYQYSLENVIIREEPVILDLEKNNIYYKNQLLFNVQKAIKFGEFVKILYKSEETEIFRYNEISIEPNSTDNLNKRVIEYFREISKYSKDIENEEQENEQRKDKESFLKGEYDKLNYIDNKSVLNYYINKINLFKPTEQIKNLIYPFRFNISQKQAMENVFKSNISIIEGPPGTGKTQTILNIIANLAIMQNKTVAVVSNNNEAVKNVKDKLEKNGYGFIVADLGNKKKRERFFQELPQPQIQGFLVDEDESILLDRIEDLNKSLDILLEKNNEKAKLEKQIEEYKLEQRYFDEYYKQQNIKKIGELSFYNKTDDRILEFILDSQILSEKKVKLQWLYKIKLLFKYGIKNLKELDENLIEIILNLQKEFYQIKIKKLEKQYSKLEKDLKMHDFIKLQKEHQVISEKLFKKELYKKYLNKNNKFSMQNYKNDIGQFLKAFPIVLSTTYSLRNSIPNNFMFDYVIIDEASQVDLLAGTLALSCAKNAIIVGDTKQLPQIVDMSIREKISNTEVDICHNYFQNSILSAILRTYDGQIPREVLKEHYRCHPKIIEFCNKRYYNNELIAFGTEEHQKVKKPLVLYYTVEGNHMRKITRGSKTGTFNERELEVIKEEVLKDSRIGQYDDVEIGITTPYRMQADNIQKSIEENIESDTIHKFQGREKKLMILSTVLDSSYRGKRGLDFVDDACMVNVAVSRAVNQFVIVTDKRLFNQEGREIKSLLKYIKYNELDSEIINSKVVSVFDLLYKEYSGKLEKLNRNLLNKSKFKSENIMDTILNREFEKEDYIDYEYRREVLVRNCLKNIEHLNEDEKRYINNGARIDFVIYDKMDKKPILFVEVDGFEFHVNNPAQLKNDKLKDNIAQKSNIDILRFETGGRAYEEKMIISAIREKIIK